MATKKSKSIIKAQLGTIVKGIKGLFKSAPQVQKTLAKKDVVKLTPKQAKKINKTYMDPMPKFPVKKEVTRKQVEKSFKQAKKN